MACSISHLGYNNGFAFSGGLLFNILYFQRHFSPHYSTNISQVLVPIKVTCQKSRIALFLNEARVDSLFVLPNSLPGWSPDQQHSFSYFSHSTDAYIHLCITCSERGDHTWLFLLASSRQLLAQSVVFCFSYG